MQEKRLTPQILERVFDKIIKENRAGTLLISDGKNEKCIYFTMTGLRMISTGSRRTGKIGQMLLAMEALYPDDLEEALVKQEFLQKQKKKGKKVLIGEVLEENQKIAHGELVAALRKQVENEIIDIYYWPEAAYEFTEGAAPPKFYDESFNAIVLNVTVKDFMTDVRRKIQEFRNAEIQIKNVWNVFELTPRGKVVLGENQHKYKDILKNIEDSLKNVMELTYGTIYNFFEMAKILDGLLEEKLIKMQARPPAQAVDFTETLKGKSRAEIEGDLEDLAAAIDKAINAVLVHNRMAASNEALNRGDEAAKHYRQVGEIQMQRENYEDSLKAFESAKRLDPHDFVSHQKMMKIYEYQKLDEKIIEIGLELGRRFLDNGLFNKAKQLFQNLSTKSPENIEIKRKLLDSYVGLGDKEGAQQELVQLEGKLKEQGKGEEYLQLLQRMVDLNMANQEIRKSLNSALGRQLMWMMTIVASSVGSIALCFIAYFSFTEYQSSTALKRAITSASEAITRGDYKSAEEAILEWNKNYRILFGPNPDDIRQKIRLRETEENIRRFRYLKTLAFEQKNPLTKRNQLSEALSIAKNYSKSEPEILAVQHEIEKELENVISAINQFEKYSQEAKILINESPEEAYRRFHILFDQFSNFPEIQQFKIPYLLQSSPPGARISLIQSTPKDIGKTASLDEDPLIALFNPSELNLLRAELPGYPTLPFEIHRKSPYLLQLTFKRDIQWSFKSNGALSAPLIESEGSLYFTSADGYFYALNAANGSLMWKKHIGIDSESRLAPLVYEKYLCLGSLAGRFLCLDRQQGDWLLPPSISNPPILPPPPPRKRGLPPPR
jgi:tetratricopeptide (TPR) repeat protein